MDKVQKHNSFNEKLQSLCCSQDVIRLVKLRRIRLAGHVSRMEEVRNTYKVLVGKPEGRNY
jgi:hypothetical protein